MVRKTKTSKKTSPVDTSAQTPVRILAVSFFAAAVTLAIGSLTFFALAVCAMAAVSALAFHRTGNVFWKEIMCVLLLFVAAIPALFLWPFAQPGSVWAFWTPSFLLVLGGLLAGSIMTLPLMQKDKNVQARYFLKALLWGTILYVLTVAAMPFVPRAWYGIAGFWGAGVMAMIFAGVLLLVKEENRGFGAATLATIFYMLLVVLGIEGRPLLPGVPSWLIMLSFAIPAVAVDLAGTRLKAWFQGACIGLVWGGVLYIFAVCFLPAQLHYGMAAAFAVLISSTIGGCLSAFVTRLS